MSALRVGYFMWRLPSRGERAITAMLPTPPGPLDWFLLAAPDGQVARLIIPCGHIADLRRVDSTVTCAVAAVTRASPVTLQPTAR